VDEVLGVSYAARDRSAAGLRVPIFAFTDARCRSDVGRLEAALAALEEADVVAGVVRFGVRTCPTPWSLLDLPLVGLRRQPPPSARARHLPSYLVGGE
jgi:hypothetical protein